MEVLIIPLEDYKKIMSHYSQTQQGIDLKFYLANLKPTKLIGPDMYMVGMVDIQDRINKLTTGLKNAKAFMDDVYRAEGYDYGHPNLEDEINELLK